MNSTYLIIGISITIILGITVFSYEAIDPNENKEVHLSSEEYDESFTVGTVSEDAAKMIKRFQPTTDHIAKNLSDKKKFKGKVIITKTLGDMEELLKNQEIDLYYDSPFGVIHLAEETGGQVILTRWKENSENYNTLYFTKKDSEINSINDLSGSTIIFQSQESTTGFMLPVATLISKGYRIGFDTNNDIDYLFSGDDENTAHWVLDGKGDVGAVSNLDFDALPMNLQSEFKIIGETKEIPRQVVMHRANMDPQLVSDVKNILLSMHKTEIGIQILDDFKHTSKYTEFDDPKKYDEIVNMLKSLPPGILD